MEHTEMETDHHERNQMSNEMEEEHPSSGAQDFMSVLPSVEGIGVEVRGCGTPWY